jgi:uncharacterized protein YjbI with pentapeptide repeats
MAEQERWRPTRKKIDFYLRAMWYTDTLISGTPRQLFRDVDLSDVDLTEVDLTGMDLTDTSLQGANLNGAILTDAKGLTLKQLSGTDLSGVDEASLPKHISEGLTSLLNQIGTSTKRTGRLLAFVLAFACYLAILAMPDSVLRFFTNTSSPIPIIAVHAPAKTLLAWGPFLASCIYLYFVLSLWQALRPYRLLPRQMQDGRFGTEWCSSSLVGDYLSPIMNGTRRNLLWWLTSVIVWTVVPTIICGVVWRAPYLLRGDWVHSLTISVFLSSVACVSVYGIDRTLRSHMSANSTETSSWFCNRSPRMKSITLAVFLTALPCLVVSVPVGCMCHTLDFRHRRIAGTLDNPLNMGGANLRGMRADSATFEYVNLADANLTNASLVGARITGARLNGANLDRANLSRAKLYDVDLRIAKLCSTNFEKVEMIFEDYGSGVTKVRGTDMRKVRNLSQSDRDNAKHAGAITE